MQMFFSSNHILIVSQNHLRLNQSLQISAHSHILSPTFYLFFSYSAANRSLALIRASLIPGSDTECPASAITINSASGQT